MESYAEIEIRIKAPFGPTRTITFPIVKKADLSIARKHDLDNLTSREDLYSADETEINLSFTAVRGEHMPMYTEELS